MVFFTRVVGIFLIGLIAVYARPEPEPQYESTSGSLSRSSENAVLCRPSESADGSINYDCDSVGGSDGPDLTIKSQHVLWLNGGAGQKDRTLNVNVPNYKIDGLIQAAQKEGGGLSNTNININLQKPVITYEAQQQEGRGEQEEKFNVNLQYEKLNGQTIHFSDEGGAGSQRYSPLRGNIADPSGSSSSSSSLGASFGRSGSQGGSRFSRGLAPEPKLRAPIKLIRIY